MSIFQPMPSAIHGFRSGEMAKVHIGYPHLPRVAMERVPTVRYPSLSSTGHKAPKTKMPMGYTMPIMTRMHAHPLDTATRLPPTGPGTH